MYDKVIGCGAGTFFCRLHFNCELGLQQNHYFIISLKVFIFTALPLF